MTLFVPVWSRMILLLLGCLLGMQACGQPETALQEEPASPTNAAPEHQNINYPAPANPSTQTPEILAAYPSPKIKPLEVIPTHAGPTPTLPGRPAGAGRIVEQPHAAMLRAYQIINAWYTTTTTETLLVFAGNFVDDPAQGVVHLAYRTRNNMQTSRNGIYRVTPTKSGAVRITGAHGMVLELATQDGTTFIFDVLTATFG